MQIGQLIFELYGPLGPLLDLHFRLFNLLDDGVVVCFGHMNHVVQVFCLLVHVQGNGVNYFLDI